MEQIAHHQPNQPPVAQDHTDEETTPENIIISTKFLKFFGGLFFFVVIFAAALTYFKSKLDDLPKDYDECVKRTGSRLQKSQPAICITLEGNYFIQPLMDSNGVPIFKSPTPLIGVSTPTPTLIFASPIPTAAGPKPCKRTGCSGQLCVDIDESDEATTCEYRAEYACYQEAPCERQANGQCGFTPSAGLSECLANAKNNQSTILR